VDEYLERRLLYPSTTLFGATTFMFSVDVLQCCNVIQWCSATKQRGNVLLKRICNVRQFAQLGLFFCCKEHVVPLSKDSGSQCFPTGTVVQHQDTTRVVTQPNLVAKCFARKSISRHLGIFSPVNCKQNLTGEMMKKTKARINTQTVVTNTL